MKIKFLIIFVFTCFIGFAQNNATITGTVTDKEMNGETLPFATVSVEGTKIAVLTDETGNYTLSVPAGAHTLLFTFMGYTEVRVNVSVAAGETKTVNQQLKSDSVTLQDVVIEKVRTKNTETALLLEMREAKQVVSAISAEQIAKSTDGNAAEAVQRVPGVTIVDGRFVMIRGLSERYNNVLLNNSIAPSTEVDKRTFSFDLIPTSSLDKMVIYKTGSADKPGDFAGGVIAVTTSENTTEFTKAEVSFGYRPGTSFDDQYRTEGSDTDWLGFDKSYRPLPNGFSSNASNIVTADQANRLPNNFSPSKKTAYFDNGFGFGLGRRIEIGSNSSLFTVNSFSYSNSYLSFDREFKRYTTLNPGETRPPLRDDFSDNVYSNSVRMNFLSNWVLRLGDNTKIRFKNLLNQQGTDETLIREGFNFLQRGPDDYLRNYYSFYQSRFIYTGQLEGEHNFGTNKKVDWVLGYNNISDNTPDFRRVRTFERLTEPDAPVRIIDSPGTNPFEAGRFYGELDEYSINNGVNFSYDIERTKDGEDIGNINLKAGYYASYRKRDFTAKYFTYIIPGYVNDPARREELISLPISEAFSPAFVNDTNGWSLREGTRPNDSYTADNTYLAGYAQTTLPLYKFDITAGVRVEHNIQTLDTRLDNGTDTNIDNPITSVLPSLNVAYNLSDRSIARLAYSRTVNRPEFRELAPFVFYDYVFDAPISGNPDLDVATIDNLDVRFEFYPTQQELISLGAFYKRFDKPIEFNALIAGDSQAFIYANADNANNYGVELEVKKSFRGLFDVAFFDRLSVNLNASYIVSEVDLGSGSLAQARKRPLQGQSPYIINAALGYSDDKNFNVNVVYNRFGDRLFTVGDNNFPSWYELSRDNIDLTISKKISNTTFKFGIQDLLNAKYRIYEDSNLDEKIRKDDDNVINSFRRGSRFTLSIGYNF